MTEPHDPLLPAGHDDWRDSQQPLDEADSLAEIAGVQAQLAAASRVLDLGCGAGRVLLPLIEAGHTVVGMDTRADFLDQCQARIHERIEKRGGDASRATLVQADVLHDWPPTVRDAGPFDAVICLGRTLATVVSPDVTVELFRRIGEALRPGGVLLVDNFPDEFWADVAEGNWQEGVSEDGRWQMLWQPGDAVVAVRYGEAVDTENWTIGPADQPIRLWTAMDFALHAKMTGLSAPQREAEGRLLAFERSAHQPGR